MTSRNLANGALQTGQLSISPPKHAPAEVAAWAGEGALEETGAPSVVESELEQLLEAVFENEEVEPAPGTKQQQPLEEDAWLMGGLMD